MVDFHREPNGVHAKGQSGWRGPATIVDLTALDEGTIGVRWNGRCILTSVRTTRPHISYPVLGLTHLLKVTQLPLSVARLKQPKESFKLTHGTLTKNGDGVDRKHPLTTPQSSTHACK